MDREELVRGLLESIGEDPTRPGLVDTPRRVSSMYQEFLVSGDPPKLTTFPRAEDGVNYDQMIVVRDIRFYSLCEHHMVPFFGTAHFGYIPNNEVIGLSKVARVINHFARRLQVQERLTTQVVEYLHEGLKARGSIAVFSAEHLCMSMRGVRAPGHRTITSAIRGNIDKEEFFGFLK